MDLRSRFRLDQFRKERIMEKERDFRMSSCKRCGKIVSLGISLCSVCEKDWRKRDKEMWLRFLDEGSTHQE